MKHFKRFIGLLLAVLMILSTVPAFADTVIYTGVELRLYNTVIGQPVKQAATNLKVTTGPEMYHEDEQVSSSGEWYYLAETEADIPAGDTEYVVYKYDNHTVYIKPVEADAIFVEGQKYLYIGTVYAADGTQFAPDCYFGMSHDIVTLREEQKMELVMRVTPSVAQGIEWIRFTCDEDGVINIRDTNPELVYVCHFSDGSNSDYQYIAAIDAPVGQFTIDKRDYQELASDIDITGTPCVTIAAVSRDEWFFERTATILAYGVYTVPLSKPYIVTDTLAFGADVNVLELGTNALGKYHSNLARATFEGWFMDKEGTTPATAEADAYAIFKVRSYCSFNPEIQASDFTLKSGNEVYTGEYLLPRTESNAYKVAFLIPSNRISVTLEVIGEGGKMEFRKHPGVDSISLELLPSGTYETQQIILTIEPGYVAKSFKVNGEPFNTLDNPFRGATAIDNDIPWTAELYAFIPKENTVITLELTEADIVTIEYGDNQPAYVGEFANEADWHSNGKYYVPEQYEAILCRKTAIIDGPRKQLKELNTKPDGSGLSISPIGYYYYYKPLPEYQNGKRDEITLYAIMECYAHTAYGAVDDSWIYYAAKEPTCTEEGSRACRYCPDCGQWQVLQDNGRYASARRSEIVIPKLPHQYTLYSNITETTHNVVCAVCGHAYTEEHTFENGVCVCGYHQYVKGDMDGDGTVTDKDALYLLYYTIFPEDYPLSQPADFNDDGVISDADALYLLYYTIFPEDYPLK